MHAWCQIYLPGAGWVEFDPTNGIVGCRDLVLVAVARTPQQAVPLSGSYDGAAADFSGMTVQVNVTTEPAVEMALWLVIAVRERRRSCVVERVVATRPSGVQL
jgi:transglutaminase-like putative cysteine protease